ncbi:MAG: hypothetical protein RLZZ241_2432 [Bacteroidota bacterium]|jgi:outer membrane protein assembly factor BamD
MFKKIKEIGLLMGFLGMLQSCSEYQKVLKEPEVSPKYELAERYYEAGDFRRANRLLEQVSPKFVGKPQGERVMFFLANSYFEIGDHNFAGYQFERFLKSYPKSDKAVEAAFLGAKSYFLLSPKYSLDQADTDKALSKLQIFINAYPDSEYLEEANSMAKELTTKKEKKAFEIAKQFVKLGKYYTLDYNISAIATLDNFISDHPGSIFREEALFLKLQSSAVLALNSTFAKKEERLDAAVAAYNTFLRYYPESTFSDQANKIIEDLKSEQEAHQKLQELYFK